MSQSCPSEESPVSRVQPCLEVPVVLITDCDSLREVIMVKHTPAGGDLRGTVSLLLQSTSLHCTNMRSQRSRGQLLHGSFRPLFLRGNRGSLSDNYSPIHGADFWFTTGTYLLSAPLLPLTFTHFHWSSLQAVAYLVV